jgi:hypothetical protein
MKALTIKQPWASLIVEGIKDIENRTWRTNFRGRIYVHCSKPTKFDVQMTDPQTIAAMPVLKQAFDGTMAFGAIIGEVDIIDCVLNHSSIWAEHKATKIKTVDGVKTEVEVPVWNWVLANPVKYDKPILNVKGALSFWEFNREASCPKLS